MNKYTVYLQNGNIVSIEATDYFMHNDYFFFSGEGQNQVQTKSNPLAQFRHKHVSGIVREEVKEMS